MIRGLSVVLCLAALPALADDAVIRVSADRGAALFADHCTECHGADATGDGALARTLGLSAPDLTGLAARAGGVFPLPRVVEVIEGRAPLPGHGTAMPSFGPLLTGADAVVDGPGGDPVRADAGILSLAAWLASVQR
jgi:mono/diheme cytochrome c family protein